jgi:hypothetical protein
LTASLTERGKLYCQSTRFRYLVLTDLAHKMRDLGTSVFVLKEQHQWGGRNRRLVPAEGFHGCDVPPNVRPCCQERPPGSHRSRGVAIVGGATVSVAVVASRTEAELIVGMLRSHGLSAVVSADDAGGQYPQMQIEGVRVLVAPSDEASARRLLAADDIP